MSSSTSAPAPKQLRIAPRFTTAGRLLHALFLADDSGALYMEKDGRSVFVCDTPVHALGMKVTSIVVCKENVAEHKYELLVEYDKMVLYLIKILHKDVVSVLLSQNDHIIAFVYVDDYVLLGIYEDSITNFNPSFPGNVFDQYLEKKKHLKRWTQVCSYIWYDETIQRKCVKLFMFEYQTKVMRWFTWNATYLNGEKEPMEEMTEFVFEDTIRNMFLRGDNLFVVFDKTFSVFGVRNACVSLKDQFLSRTQLLAVDASSKNVVTVTQPKDTNVWRISFHAIHADKGSIDHYPFYKFDCAQDKWGPHFVIAFDKRGIVVFADGDALEIFSDGNVLPKTIAKAGADVQFITDASAQQHARVRLSPACLEWLLEECKDNDAKFVDVTPDGRKIFTTKTPAPKWIVPRNHKLVMFSNREAKPVVFDDVGGVYEL